MGMFNMEPAAEIDLDPLFEYTESILMDVIRIRSQDEEDGEEDLLEGILQNV